MDKTKVHIAIAPNEETFNDWCAVNEQPGFKPVWAETQEQIEGMINPEKILLHLLEDYMTSPVYMSPAYNQLLRNGAQTLVDKDTMRLRVPAINSAKKSK